MNEQRSYGIMTAGASRFKRKEMESVYPAKRSPLAPPPPPPPKLPRATVTASTTVTTSKGSKGMEVTSSNKLMAGLMAYEFLTKGTLLGQRFDSAKGKSPRETEAETEMARKGNESYKEITSLMMMTKSDGEIHIPGIVNPTQLARWIQM